MGLLDKFKKTADDVKDKAADHVDDIEKGIDKAADVIDDKTGHKHSDQIDKVADKAKDIVGKLDDK